MITFSISVLEISFLDLISKVIYVYGVNLFGLAMVHK